jgi:hypothetical protein
MLRYRVLVFAVESKLENKLVVSLSCRLGTAKGTKVPLNKKNKKIRGNAKIRLTSAHITDPVAAE